jgi:uncharacterized protein (TIGR00369 family)
VTRLPPYAETLGIEAVPDADGPLYRMKFGDVVLGRPGFLHGGAIAGLLEIAAIGTLLEALDGQGNVKPINLSVSFMRGGTQQDTFASANIVRLGARIAQVEAHAWQADRTKPIASAQLNLMVRRTG